MKLKYTTEALREKIFNLAKWIVDYEFFAPNAKYTSRESLIRKYDAMIADLFTAQQQALLDEVEKRLPEIPFVSFESCRSAADYDERQALRKLIKEVKELLEAIRKEIV